MKSFSMKEEIAGKSPLLKNRNAKSLAKVDPENRDFENLSQLELFLFLNNLIFESNLYFLFVIYYLIFCRQADLSLYVSS